MGSTLAYLNRRYQQRKKIDPIVPELKRECALVIPVYINGKPIKPIMERGGAEIMVRSDTIKSKKLAKLVFKIIRLRKKYKQIKFLQLFFAALSSSLTFNLGLRVVVGGSLNYVNLIIIIFPSTVAGYLIEQAISNPLVSILWPLILTFGRGGDDSKVEDDPLEKCRLLCKFAEQYHNRELKVEMEILNSALEDASTALQLPLDKVPLMCVEEKLSLLERFKLKQLIKS